MFYKFADFPDFKASTSEYTNLSVNLRNIYSEMPETGSAIDVQVQAQIGHIDSMGDGFFSFTGESSDWSSTQTVTVDMTSASISPNPDPSQTPSPTPSVPEISWFVLPMFLSVLSMTAILMLRKNYATHKK